jgi:hypothetical protein
MPHGLSYCGRELCDLLLQQDVPHISIIEEASIRTSFSL